MSKLTTGTITYLLCGDQYGRGGCGAVVSFRPNLAGSAAIAAWNRRAPAGEDARPTIADLIDAKLAEGDKRDAARYRWLRDLPDGSPYECIGNMPGDRWDDEIDAVIAAAERGGAPDLP